MKSMESPPGTGVGSVPDIGIACCHFSLSQSFPALRSSVLQTTLETVLAKVASRPHFSRSFSAQTILGAAQAKVDTTLSHLSLYVDQLYLYFVALLGKLFAKMFRNLYKTLKSSMMYQCIIVSCQM